VSQRIVPESLTYVNGKLVTSRAADATGVATDIGTAAAGHISE